MPVPANAQFSVVNVQNRYGCNDMSTLSMYRRPLPSTNLRFLSTVMFDGRESSPQTGTQKITYATNPADLLADLAHQAIDATTGHAQAATLPTPQQVQDIVNFEMQLRTAQAIDFRAGSLNADGASGGPVALASQPFFVGINDSFPPSFHFNPSGAPFNPAIFDRFNAWVDSYNPARASIARGQAVFNTKPIAITGVAGINDVLGMASLQGTCGTCHDAPNVGNHSVSAPLKTWYGRPDESLGCDLFAGVHAAEQHHRSHSSDDRPRPRPDHRVMGGHRKSQGAHSSRACSPRAIFSQRLGREFERRGDVL